MFPFLMIYYKCMLMVLKQGQKIVLLNIIYIIILYISSTGMRRGIKAHVILDPDNPGQTFRPPTPQNMGHNGHGTCMVLLRP